MYIYIFLFGFLLLLTFITLHFVLWLFNLEKKILLVFFPFFWPLKMKFFWLCNFGEMTVSSCSFSSPPQFFKLKICIFLVLLGVFFCHYRGIEFFIFVRTWGICILIWFLFWEFCSYIE